MKTIYCLLLLSLLYVNDVLGQYYYNRALNLPGVAGNYAVTDPGSNLSITGSLTMECWVYQTSATGAQIVIQKRLGTGSTGYTLYINGGKVVIRTNGTSRLTGTTTIPLNTWTHVGATYNSTTNVFTIYVNGLPDGTVTTASAAPAADTDSLRFGVGFNSPFVGMMDEVRIWNVERSAADMLATYRMPLGETGASGPYTGLVGAWRFNSVTGGSGTDEVGGNTAYLRGTASFADLTNKPNNHLTFNTGLMCTGAPTGTCVSIANAPQLNPTTALTLECWVWHNNATVQVIVGKGSAGYPYRIVKSTGASFRVFINGVAPGTGNYGGIIPNSKWTHLAFTYDVASQTYAYYMNGVQTQTGTQALTFPTNTDPVTIGGGTGLVTFAGMIDEVRISTFAKTPAQIAAGVFASSDVNNGANTVAYNFEGTLADYGNSGPRGVFTGTLTGIRFTQTYNNSAELPIPTDRWDAGNFGAGYRCKYTDLAFGTAPTTVTDSIFMPQTLSITDVNVFVAAHHTYANDISVSLINPAGTTTRILYPGGGSNVGMHMITIFDDQADSTIGGLAPWSPRVKPTNTLAIFNGQPAAGWWKLVLTDNFPSADNGVFAAWGIQFNNQTITGVSEPVSTGLPVSFALHQNYPNPFNPVTTIKYDLPKDAFTVIKVYDVTGREVAVLVNQFKKAGFYSLTMDGGNLSSGAYFYRIEAGDFVEVKKMILLK